jgi:hypothetical protein
VLLLHRRQVAGGQRAHLRHRRLDDRHHVPRELLALPVPPLAQRPPQAGDHVGELLAHLLVACR